MKKPYFGYTSMFCSSEDRNKYNIILNAIMGNIMFILNFLMLNQVLYKHDKTALNISSYLQIISHFFKAGSWVN